MLIFVTVFRLIYVTETKTSNINYEFLNSRETRDGEVVLRLLTLPLVLFNSTVRFARINVH